MKQMEGEEEERRRYRDGIRKDRDRINRSRNR
jgi:hypothetical protein